MFERKQHVGHGIIGRRGNVFWDSQEGVSPLDPRYGL